jgi:excisionase family DNA binding protein
VTSSPLRPYDDADAYLLISRSKLERLVAAGAIGHVKVGSRVLFTQDDLDAFIAASRVEPTAARPSRPARRAARASGPNLSVVGANR